jgi:hypothetical protein
MNQRKPLPVLYESDDLSDVGWLELVAFLAGSTLWLGTLVLVAIALVT